MKNNIFLICICSLLSSSISAMKNNILSITNNTASTIYFYQTSGDNSTEDTATPRFCERNLKMF